MSIQDELEALNAVWLEAFSRGDAEACADLWTENGAIYSPYGPPAIGREAIKQAHQDWLSAGEINKNLEILEAGGDGNTAFLVASYSGDYPTEDGGYETESGKVVNVCTRHPDGRWKFHIGSLNSDKPPLAGG
jgi:uncharacterized protein (TIGR02246 family)